MDKKFYCDLCEVTCSSGYELARHLRSKEHRDKLHFGTDSVMEKFIKDVRKSIMKGKEEGN